MRRCAIGLVLVLALTSCAAPKAIVRTDAVAEPPKNARGFAVGYLESPPNGKLILAAPPREGSALQRAELGVVRSLRQPRNDLRWAQAIADNEIDPLAAFAAPFGRTLTPDDMANSLRLLSRLNTDITAAYEKAKEEFARPRPFVTDAAIEICVTDEAGRARLANSKAYPSGHAAFGWAWALLFAEAAPERADAILERGRAYGDSRVVCGVHYPSDVEAGRLIGAAVVARLRADPQFSADFAILRAELRQALRLSSP